jgi:hypothetical protein
MYNNNQGYYNQNNNQQYSNNQQQNNGYQNNQQNNNYNNGNYNNQNNNNQNNGGYAYVEPLHALATKNQYGRIKQMIRIDSLDSFVEVLNDKFHSDKIVFNFQKYDKNNGNKTISKITFWMKLEDFLAIYKQMSIYVHKCKDVRAKAQPEANQNGKSIFPSSLCDLFAGSSAELLAKYNNSRPDGMAESRKFSIVPAGVKPERNDGKQQYQNNKVNSTTTDIVLTAEKGPGIADANGLIQPNYGKAINGRYVQAEEVIRVPMSYDKFIALFELVYMNYQAYLTSEVYMNRALDLIQERKQHGIR